MYLQYCVNFAVLTIAMTSVHMCLCSYISVCWCFFLCTSLCVCIRDSLPISLLLRAPVAPLLLCVCVSVVHLSETEGFHSTLHGCTRKPSRGCEVSSGERSQSEHSNWGTKEREKWVIPQIPQSHPCWSRLSVVPLCFVLISFSPYISIIFCPWVNLSSNSLLCAAGWIYSSGRGSSAGTWKCCSPAHKLRHQGESPAPCAAHCSTQRWHTHSCSAPAKRPQSWCTQQGMHGCGCVRLLVFGGCYNCTHAHVDCFLYVCLWVLKIKR